MKKYANYFIHIYFIPVDKAAIKFAQNIRKIKRILFFFRARPCYYSL